MLFALLAAGPARAGAPRAPFAATLARAGDPDSESREYNLKAAYLYNFANFVKWPPERFADETAPIVVAIVGEDPFGKLLERTFKDKKVGKRPLQLERFEDASKLADCHVLFVSRSEKKSFAKIVEYGKPRSILIVTEMDGAIGHGGIVNFFIEKKRVRFEIQIDEAKRFKLTISSKLLQLARVVRDEKGKRDREKDG